MSLKTTLLIGNEKTGKITPIQTSLDVEKLNSELVKLSDHYCKLDESGQDAFYAYKESKEIYYTLYNPVNTEEKRALQAILSEASGLGMKVDELSKEALKEFIGTDDANKLEAYADE